MIPKFDFSTGKPSDNWMLFGFNIGFYRVDGWWSVPVEIALFKKRFWIRMYKE